MLVKVKVRRGCIVPSPLNFPSTRKSNGTEQIASTGSMVDCSVLLEIQLVGNHLRVDTTLILCVGFHSF